MNKELSELKELIAEQERDEELFQERTDKRMAKITALTARIQARASAEPKPVGPITYSRDKPRKPRSDKGKPRTIAASPDEPPVQTGQAIDPDEPIGEVVGQLRE